MYDSYEPFKQYPHIAFHFQSHRFELWESGRVILSKNNSTLFSANVKKVSEDGLAITEITHDSNKILYVLTIFMEFDILISLNDRLQLLTIPAEANSNECIGLHASRLNIGSTRQSKPFQANEPFCCNIFTKDGIIKKLTFSLNHPERLIEFY